MCSDKLTPEQAAIEGEIGVLTWDDTFPIALALCQAHPEADLEQVSLAMIYRWTLDLPAFADDPQLANEEILSAIFQEWLEEVLFK